MFQYHSHCRQLGTSRLKSLEHHYTCKYSNISASVRKFMLRNKIKQTFKKFKCSSILFSTNLQEVTDVMAVGEGVEGKTNIINIQCHNYSHKYSHDSNGHC